MIVMMIATIRKIKFAFYKLRSKIKLWIKNRKKVSKEQIYEEEKKPDDSMIT